MMAMFTVLERSSEDARGRKIETETNLNLPMSVSTPLPAKAPPLQKETTVGNYFVSNYPPFSFWKPEFVPELKAALDRAPSTLNSQPSTVPLGLYVHIPFCRKRCHFCYFKVYTDKNSAAIRNYLDALLREFSLYAGKPFVGGRRRGGL